MKRFALLLLLPFAAQWQANAQAWDTSGNGLLNGSYYFRHVAWQVDYNYGTGDLNDAVAIYGNITFDGNGNYTLSGQAVFASSGVQNYKANGTYSIAANGYGFLSSPILPGDQVEVLVSQGIVLGSSTENTNLYYNDMFVAAPLATPALVNSNFQGAYSMLDLDFPYPGQQSNSYYTRASSFQITADGNGGIGTVRLTGYLAGNAGASRATTQNVSGVKYFFSNGAANVNFGGSLNSTSGLIAGTKYFYFSPDGNFIFGGSPTGWDMILGVKSGGSAPKFSGLYYAAGVSQDNTNLASQGYVDLTSGFGSVNAMSGYLLAHERIFDPFNNNPVDYTYSDGATANTDGTSDDSFNHYVFGNGGAIGIGLATSSVPGGSLGIEALVRAPTFSGDGVYIFPTGIVNAGSSAPFTAGLAPGELVSISGTNLTSATASDPSLPTTLGNVQVLVNGTPAPIYSVCQLCGGQSYDVIEAVIPMSTTQLIAAIQVVNGDYTSNMVTNYVGLTQPGPFPNNINGIDYATAYHGDGSAVTPDSPAGVGETIQVSLTGLGALDASNNTTDTFTAAIAGVAATVSSVGSSSPLGGAYQMNIVVPSGLPAGDDYLDIAGPDSYNSTVALPIRAGNGTRVVGQGHALPRQRMALPHKLRTGPTGARRR